MRLARLAVLSPHAHPLLSKHDHCGLTPPMSPAERGWAFAYLDVRAASNDWLGRSFEGRVQSGRDHRQHLDDGDAV